MPEMVTGAELLANAAASTTSSGSTSSVSISVSTPSEANSSDAAFFSAALNEPRKVQGVGVADRIIGQLTGGAGKLQELERGAMKDLRTAAKGKDSGDMVTAARSVSEFYLESLLAAKVVGKGVQAIEKLTNLQ